MEEGPISSQSMLLDEVCSPQRKLVPWWRGGPGQGSFYTSLKSLIATTQSAGAEHASVWNVLPHLPFPFSSPVMFNDQLITIGGGYCCSSAVHADSHPTKSWVNAGDLPIFCKSTCTLILPSGELLVVGGETYFGLSSLAFRAKLRGNLLHNYTVG